jgi:cytochrome c
MKKLAIALTLVLAFAASTALAADGKALYAKCIGCHGADGSKTNLGNKPLKGLKADVISAALHGYKAKTFGGAKKSMMEPLAAAMSDADMKTLSEHISKF